MSTNNNGYFSLKDAPSSTDDYNSMVYIIRHILQGAHHCAIVRVVAVNDGEVDVQPMVNMLDGEGNAIEHGVVNGLRFFRMQAGTSAVIIDPRVDDIGVAVIADRDTSSVVAARDLANPGSMRSNDLADGIYFGGVLNADPEQYISFTDAGIKIFSPTLVRLESPKRIEIEAPSVEVVSNYVKLDAPVVSATGNVLVEGGATGTFSTPQGTVVTVKNGIVTNIY